MNPLLGSIRLFAPNFAPKYFMPCDGQLLQIAQNTALFSLLGTMYGGDGVRTFALPKFPPMQLESGGSILVCIAVQGVFPSRP